MTISELYEWAKDNGVEEYDLVTVHETGEGVSQIYDAYIDYERREVELCQVKINQEKIYESRNYV